MNSSASAWWPGGRTMAKAESAAPPSTASTACTAQPAALLAASLVCELQ